MHIFEVQTFDESVLQNVTGLLHHLSDSHRSPDVRHIVSVIDNPNSFLFFAKEKEVLGMLTLVVYIIPSGVCARIEDVVVSPMARGKGIGSALMQHAMEFAREQNAKYIDLTSRPSREAANRLYQKLGFELRETNVYRFNFQ